MSDGDDTKPETQDRPTGVTSAKTGDVDRPVLNSGAGRPENAAAQAGASPASTERAGEKAAEATEGTEPSSTSGGPRGGDIERPELGALGALVKTGVEVAKATTDAIAAAIPGSSSSETAPAKAPEPEQQATKLGEWAKTASPEEIRGAIAEREQEREGVDSPQIDAEIETLKIELEERELQATADRAREASPEELKRTEDRLSEETSTTDSPRAQQELEIVRREGQARERAAVEDHARSIQLEDLRSEIKQDRDELSRSSSPARERELAAKEEVLNERSQQGTYEWAQQQKVELEGWHGATDSEGFPRPANALPNESWAAYLYRHGASLDALRSLGDLLGRPAHPRYTDAERREAVRTGMRFDRELRELEDGLRDRWTDEAKRMPFDELQAARNETTDRIASSDYSFDRYDDKTRLEIYDTEFQSRITEGVKNWAQGMPVEELGAEVDRLEQEAAANPTPENHAVASAAGELFRSRVWGDTHVRAQTMPMEALNDEIKRLESQTTPSRADAERLGIERAVKSERDLARSTQEYLDRHRAEMDAKTVRQAEAGPTGVMNGTPAQIDHARMSAYVQGGLDAFTGLFSGAVTMWATDNPGLAAIAGSLMDAAGGVARGRNENIAISQSRPPTERPAIVREPVPGRGGEGRGAPAGRPELGASSRGGSPGAEAVERPSFGAEKPPAESRPDVHAYIRSPETAGKPAGSGPSGDGGKGPAGEVPEPRPAGSGWQRRDVGINIDEPKAVGEPGISQQEAMRRAIDLNNRQLLDPLTNQATKREGIEVPIAQRTPQPEVSVVDNPSAIVDRPLGEIKEWRELSAIVLDKRGPGLDGKSPGEVKDILNRALREELADPKTEPGRVLSNALQQQFGVGAKELFGSKTISKAPWR